MTKKYDSLVFIGRFQPFHLGHKNVIREALTLAEKVIVVVGSSNQSRNLRNPFTFEERSNIIKQCMSDDYISGRIEIAGVSDYPYDDNKWISTVRDAVEKHTSRKDNIGIVGHNKDETSYYLKMFQGWTPVEVNNFRQIDATTIRNEMFVAGNVDNHDGTLADGTVQYIHSILSKRPAWFDNLQTDYFLVKKYKKSWEDAPYPPIFQTVDAVVIQSGHVLLVERKSSPGKGQWALPGGFLDNHERLIDGMLRELDQETKIKLPEKILRRNVVGRKVFDDPNRSTRGRTITTAFHIDLGFENQLPKVKGHDDAKQAMWVPLNRLKQDHMFEDHYFIIDHFTGLDRWLQS